MRKKSKEVMMMSCHPKILRYGPLEHLCQWSIKASSKGHQAQPARQAPASQTSLPLSVITPTTKGHPQGGAAAAKCMYWRLSLSPISVHKRSTPTAPLPNRSLEHHSGQLNWKCTVHRNYSQGACNSSNLLCTPSPTHQTDLTIYNPPSTLTRPLI